MSENTLNALVAAAVIGFFGGLGFLLADSTSKKAECVKANTHRTAAEVVVVCRF